LDGGCNHGGTANNGKPGEGHEPGGGVAAQPGQDSTKVVGLDVVLKPLPKKETGEPPVEGGPPEQAQR
jgi:hypothetical protein